MNDLEKMLANDPYKDDCRGGLFGAWIISVGFLVVGWSVIKWIWF